MKTYLSWICICLLLLCAGCGEDENETTKTYTYEMVVESLDKWSTVGEESPAMAELAAFVDKRIATINETKCKGRWTIMAIGRKEGADTLAVREYKQYLPEANKVFLQFKTDFEAKRLSLAAEIQKEIGYEIKKEVCCYLKKEETSEIGTYSQILVIETVSWLEAIGGKDYTQNF